MRGSRLATALIVLALCLSADAAFAQCAMCRRALDSPEGRRMIAAFQDGILVLLAAPFGLFALLTTLVVRMLRRRQSQNAAMGKSCFTSRSTQS